MKLLTKDFVVTLEMKKDILITLSLSFIKHVKLTSNSLAYIHVLLQCHLIRQPVMKIQAFSIVFKLEFRFKKL